MQAKKEKRFRKDSQKNREWFDREEISSGAQATFGEAGRLCLNWNPAGENIAGVAFWVAHSFGAQTGIVPTNYAYLVDELATMQDFGHEYGNYFGKTVWECMQQAHPSLHLFYERINRVLTDTYGVATGQENIQKAGIGLAYLLATQSAMLRMDHEYTADGM